MPSSRFDPIFNVKWINHTDAIAHGISVLYQKQQQFDLTIKLKDGELEAHRLIMGIASSVFRDRLEVSPKESRTELKFLTISYSSMEQLLKYIYSGSVKIQKSKIKDFVRTARILKVYTSVSDMDVNEILKGMFDKKPAELIWKNRGEQFIDSFQTLYRAQMDWDVTFLIQGKEIKAHRTVLSACSTLFEHYCNMMDGEAHMTLPMHHYEDLTYSQLDDVLTFIYFGVVKVNDIAQLLKNGELLEIFGLNEKKGDEIWAVKTDEENPLRHEMRVKANGIPVDFKLLPTDVVISDKELTLKNSVRKSNSSQKSGSEYEPDKDSDEDYHFKTKNHQRLRRNAKLPPTQIPITVAETKPAKSASTEKKSKCKSRKRSNQNPMNQHNVQSIDDDNKKKDETDTVTVTFTKDQYERMLQAMAQLDNQSSGEVSETESRADCLGGYYQDSKQDHNEHGKQELLAVDVHNDCNNNDDFNYDYTQYDINDEPNGIANINNFEHVDDPYYENDLSTENGVDFEEGAVGGAEYQYEQNNQEENQENVCQKLARKCGKTQKQKNYNVQAVFEKSGQGSIGIILIHNGYRFSRCRVGKDYVRWQCTKKIHSIRCSAFAFTKEINGITMAHIPQHSEHKYGEACQSHTK